MTFLINSPLSYLNKARNPVEIVIFTTPSFYDVSEKSHMDPFSMKSTLGRSHHTPRFL